MQYNIAMHWSLTHWSLWALLSALFAAATNILAKLGVKDVGSNLALAIRVSVVLIAAWAIVLFRGEARQVATIAPKTWLFLVLSGLATGASWLCYFKALSLGDASRIAPIDKLSIVLVAVLSVLILHEKFTWQLGFGYALITIGILVTLKG
jgi:bacterial/archaeal transporter family protein